MVAMCLGVTIYYYYIRVCPTYFSNFLKYPKARENFVDSNYIPYNTTLLLNTECGPACCYDETISTKLGTINFFTNWFYFFKIITSGVHTCKPRTWRYASEDVMAYS